MATTRSTIFRVTGLPIGPEEQVILSLRLAINQHASSSELQRLGRITIAPSCYNDQASVALLEWKGNTPKFLSTLDMNPLSSWEIELDDQDISFDRHFFGFTQLYNTASEQPISAESVSSMIETNLSTLTFFTKHHCCDGPRRPCVWFFQRKGKSWPNVAP
jgi:hypothetical protein